MAEVKLGRFEAEEGELPPLCLRCGAPAALFKAKRLSWQPTWTFLAFGLTVWPLLLVTMMIRKRMRALLPFCAKHKSYWARESAKVKGVIGSLFILFVIGFILIIETEASGLHTVHPLVLFWLAGPAIMIAVLCLRARSICVMEIADDRITLAGVAEAFVQEWRAERSLRSCQRSGPAEKQAVPPAKYARWKASEHS